MMSLDKKSRRRDLFSGAALLFATGLVALSYGLCTGLRQAYVAAAVFFFASCYAFLLTFRKGADDDESRN